MSVCVDDIDMRVTHVIRGEDHLSNTPKHIPLFRALLDEVPGEVPVFAHLPLILGPDKKRLSKRTGATSVEEFRAEGILPQALYNFMALLGWTPGDDREIFTRKEMAEIFSVERLNASAAVFDREKLLWMNAQYLSKLTVEKILPHLQPFLEAQGLADADPARLAGAIELQRSRAHTLKELAQALLPYFQDRLDYDPALSAKFQKDSDLPGHLETLAERYAALPSFDKGSLEAALRELAEERGLKAGVLIHPTRMALSGLAGGPPLFDLVEVMGRDAVARHLANFVEFLKEAPVPAPAAEG
jgi:glutamyl-tRNA synthetase